MSSLTQFTSKLAKLKTVNFTSSGTFTVPSGVTTIIVTMISAGGGYARDGYYTVYSYIGGGGGGYYLNEPVEVTPGSTLTVTVGAGGTSSYRYNPNGTVYGSATIGGSSSIYNGATKLLQTFGGFYGTDVNYTSRASGFGYGGWPNGAGGGAYGDARSGSSGAGGQNSLGNSSAYSMGTDTNVDASAGAVGMGEFPGASYYSGGSPIPGNYGIGADGSGTFTTSNRTPGTGGFVQISYFEV